MLDANFLLHCSEPAEELASELHNYIIKEILERMMLRIGRGEDYLLTARDKWQIQVLQDAGYLLGDITQEIASFTRKSEQEIKEAMEEAGVKALSYDDMIYKAAGLDPKPLEQSPYLIRVMERSYKATNGEMRNFTRTMAQASQKLFIQEMDTAYNLVASGTISYTQAVMQAVDNVANEGVVVTYRNKKTGKIRKDTIETATLRCVRTGISQMSGDITLARMEEIGWDIILVSAHNGARTGDGGQNPGNHLWWQGQYYSRNGKDKRFPPFSQTGYGSGEGLGGWNCRHSFSAGTGNEKDNPYKDIQKQDNYKMEQLEQRQRTLERRIRATKRRLQAQKVEIDNCTDEALKFELQGKYDRTAYTLQRQNKAYNDFCQENDLKRLNDRIRIAKWDRQQAASARGAARRYENAKGK